MQVKDRLKDTASEIGWYFKQLFSTSPDSDVQSGVKMLQFMAKGLLIVGALSSMSYTTPTFYNIWNGLLPTVLAQAITIICVVLMLFLIELSFGALTPFALKYSIDTKHPNYVALVAIWLFVAFLGLASMYFTWNGAAVPVHAAITPPSLQNIGVLAEKKDSALMEKQKIYLPQVQAAAKADSTHLAELKASHKTMIKDARVHAAQKAKSYYSPKVKEAVKKARLDSSRAVAAFEPTLPQQQRIMESALYNVRHHWDGQIEEAKKSNSETKQVHSAKVEGAMMLIQGFGAGSTLLFFILSIIVTLLNKGGKKKLHP